MAYAASALNPIGGQSRRGTGVALWSYHTSDTPATVDTAGYFNDASGLLSVNDVIMVMTTSSGAGTDVGFHIVNSNSSGVVDVTDVLELHATSANDTD